MIALLASSVGIIALGLDFLPSSTFYLLDHLPCRASSLVEHLPRRPPSLVTTTVQPSLISTMVAGHSNTGSINDHYKW